MRSGGIIKNQNFKKKKNIQCACARFPPPRRFVGVGFVKSIKCEYCFELVGSLCDGVWAKWYLSNPEASNIPWSYLYDSELGSWCSLGRPNSSQLAPKIRPKSIQKGTTWPPRSVQNGTWAILRPQISLTIIFMTASLVRDAASGLQIPPNSLPKFSQNRSSKHSA